MKKRKQARRILAAVLAGSLLLSVSAFAYDRQEASTIGGGTEVTVYAGTQNSNSEGNYLEDPGDYMAYNRYETPGYETSESNITSSTNFTATSAGGEIKIVNGGVAGVSWDNSNNTLTLNSATGTVITIEGPEIDPYSVNTYNDKLNPLIGDNLQNLTYYKQYDLFTFTGQEAGAPHTKDNSTVQDVVYINIEGENSFNNIVITGNVKVVFTGTGTLTLDASQTWDYDDYNDPDFDHLSDPSTEALASYPTVGYQGTLSGMVEEDVMSNARMTETVTEWYEYALPEIVIDGSMYISEGGSVYNTAAVDSDSEYQAWESYVGTEDSPASKVVITAVTFTDVQDSTRYFYTPVYWAYENGITDGMTETTFVPAGDCTRAQFVTFLYRLAGEPDVTGLTTAFTDLDSSRFYYNAVLWAEANNITEGMTDTTFEPSTTITRAQAVTFLYRYAKYVNGSEPEVTITSTPFTDLDSARFYYTAVLWAYENGIAKGMTDTTFEPGTTCNRGMMVTFLYRLAMLGSEEDETLVTSFAVNMNGEGTLINDEMYDELYAEGSANEGILAIIEAGNFVINGYAIPGTEEDYLANWADTGYLVNASAWVTQNENGTWTTSSRKAAGPYDTVAEACLAILTVKDQLNGQDICLYDKDGDGYVDVIELSYVSAIIVNGITDNGDGTYSVDSGYIAQGTVGTEKPYDGDAFSADSDRVINAENFDDSIEFGDVAIFYYGTDGWVLTRALEITGVLTEAVDHDHYTVNDTEYGDAMMFSRDNLVISNRNGEYANAYMYFGMDDLEMEVSLWLVPTTNYPTSTGAPIGITSSDASASLTEALKQAQAKLDSVVVSDETGASALEEGTQWVTQETYDQLKAAIDRASEALESESRADLLDYQVYLLYLTLHGSADDIGASFAGYTYDGFDNLINTATGAEETA